jgi:hypothetical protein
MTIESNLGWPCKRLKSQFPEHGYFYETRTLQMSESCSILFCASTFSVRNSKFPNPNFLFIFSNLQCDLAHKLPILSEKCNTYVRYIWVVICVVGIAASRATKFFDNFTLREVFCKFTLMVKENRKITGSISIEFVGFFNWLNPSSRTVALGSTQPLNRNEYQGTSWG